MAEPSSRPWRDSTSGSRQFAASTVHSSVVASSHVTWGARRSGRLLYEPEQTVSLKHAIDAFGVDLRTIRLASGMTPLFARLVVSHFTIRLGSRDMTISPGFTAAEIREFVHEYQAQPYGAKAPWLITRGLSRAQVRRWRDAVFEGDLDRGLVPRESNPMTVPPSQRAALEKYRAAERAAHEAEVARISARIRELEGTNDALGKAIGLLHSMSEQESDEPTTTTDPTGS